jgi:hypothetical protein
MDWLFYAWDEPTADNVRPSSSTGTGVKVAHALTSPLREMHTLLPRDG